MSFDDAAYLSLRLLLGALSAVAAAMTLRYALNGRPTGWRLSVVTAGGLLLTFAAALSVWDGIKNGFIMANEPVPRISWMWLLGFDMLLPLWAFMLLRAWRARDEAEALLARLAVTDLLTNVLNRRGFHEQAHTTIAQARRTRTPVSVAMFDIDRFKSVNDGYGHDAGDAVLRGFAAILAEGVRAADVLGRIGGEEFALLMPGSTPEQALVLVERLRAAVRDGVVHPARDGRVLTVSAGIAAIPDMAEEESALAQALRSADEALYAAKDQGRDRALIAAPAAIAA